MKLLKEYQDGFRWIDGNTSSAPFEKDSDTYNEKLSEGYELVLIPQSEKDAHEAEQVHIDLIAQLTDLDVSQRTLEDAMLGDEFALAKLQEAAALKAEIRKGL